MTERPALYPFVIKNAFAAVACKNPEKLGFFIKYFRRFRSGKCNFNDAKSPERKCPNGDSYGSARSGHYRLSFFSKIFYKRIDGWLGKRLTQSYRQ